ncbi:MAG: hypothetical protein P4L83_05025 [Nevskia sp.]|nr:hypothetical protein [Nevskia sp.]
MKIDLHIERLVVDGLELSSAEARRLRRSVERELARLLTDGGLAQSLARGAAVPRLQAPAIALPPRATPEATGGRIAAAVHSSLAPAKP